MSMSRETKVTYEETLGAQGAMNFQYCVGKDTGMLTVMGPSDCREGVFVVRFLNVDRERLVRLHEMFGAILDQWGAK